MKSRRDPYLISIKLTNEDMLLVCRRHREFKRHPSAVRLRSQWENAACQVSRPTVPHRLLRSRSPCSGHPPAPQTRASKEACPNSGPSADLGYAPILGNDQGYPPPQPRLWLAFGAPTRMPPHPKDPNRAGYPQPPLPSQCLHPGKNIKQVPGLPSDNRYGHQTPACMGSGSN